MKRVILVTGGQRSGKSTYAEKLVLELSGEEKSVYMATSRIWDEEFARRVEIHKQRRGPQWINIEEEKFLSRHNVEGKVVLIDCVTLWSTNFFFDLSAENPVPGEQAGSALHSTMDAQEAAHSGSVVEKTLQQIKDEFEKFTAQDATFVFVTNEIGLGGVSENKLQRQYTDLLGWLNQYLSSRADDVYFMVSGIPMKIK